MSFESILSIIAIILGPSSAGVIIAFINRPSKRKSKSDADKTMVETMNDSMDVMVKSEKLRNDRLKILEERLDELEQINIELRKELQICRNKEEICKGCITKQKFEEEYCSKCNLINLDASKKK